MSNARPFAYAVIVMLLLQGCANKKLESEISNLALDRQILETRLSLAEDRIVSLQTQVDEIHERVYSGAQKEAEPFAPTVTAIPAAPARTTVAAIPAAPAKTDMAAIPVRTAPPAPAKKEEVKAAAPRTSSENAYKNALDTFMAHKYGPAENMFTDFINKYPESSLRPNAGYWLGECHYAQKRYDEAILSFQGVVRDYPKHQKAADALLKTGYSYEKLGDKANARFYLQQVLEIYPATSAAPLARYMLAGLG